MALLRRGSAGRAESGGVGGEGVEDRDNSHDFWYGAVRPLGDELHLDQAPRRDALGYGPHAAAAQLSGRRRTCGGEGGSAWLRDPAPHPPPVSPHLCPRPTPPCSHPSRTRLRWLRAARRGGVSSWLGLSAGHFGRWLCRPAVPIAFILPVQ